MPKLNIVRVAVVTVAVSVLTAGTCVSADPGYVPGLGEFMTATQMRHAKLWLAGKAENWPLAAYELEEIQEGFDTIVKYHPVHEGSPVPVREILPELTGPPLAALRSAVASGDVAAFEQGFDALTAACNACHRAENFGFIVIRRPRGNPYPNQDFSPRRSETASGAEPN